jgi:Helix-turn-helix domain
MSAKERDRLAVIRQVADRKMKQGRAGELLDLEVRQVKRLVRAYRQRGDRGLVSGRRGKPSNNRLAAATVAVIERTLKERYADFGPTFAAEMRIPTKPARHSNMKPATRSEMKPAMVPI